MTISDLHYISAIGATSWLVRVPHRYHYHSNAKYLKYKQKSFPFLKLGGIEKALSLAIKWRDINLMKGLTYNDRGPSAGNGKQVKMPRIRGYDLPAGITDTVQMSRQGKEQHSITVQACCGKIRRTKSLMYGHSRTREEAISSAKKVLINFLDEFEL